MAPGYCFVISSFILMMGNVGLNPVRGQISWTPMYIDTSNRLDLWTVSSTGCECPDRKSLTGCACCVKPGGCLCSKNLNKCAQCGLEDSCQRTCNVTISARSVATRSGLSWVHLQSQELQGPNSCFWILESAPGQRIEVQIHRIISVGSFDNSSQTCKDGFLQFADGDTAVPSTQAIQLCGQNSRFSPPVVLFGDGGIATLYLRIEGKSSRSQVLAYVSFSSSDDPNVGVVNKFGRLRPHSVCDWTYDNCWQTECIFSSPGFPGLYPPHRRCRYFLVANSTEVKILIRFQTLNIPPPPLCSSHHVAIWRKNVSNLAYLTPPWKTLCRQEFESTVEVEGGQALIEFRSGSTTSPNLWNGFRASVEFHHSATTSRSTPSPKRTIPTIDPKYESRITEAVAKNYTSPTTKVPTSKVKTTVKSIDEPLGHARAQDDLRSFKPQIVTCGHIFDGNTIREEGFRLKIPKDISTTGKKNSEFKFSTFSGSFHCRLDFLGKSKDIVQLALSNYKLRGSNCSSQIEVYDVLEEETGRNKTSVDRLFDKLCGPSSNEVTRFTSTYNGLAISVVILSSDSPIGSAEVLEGAFRFHDESIDGTVKPHSSCEVVYYGMTSPPSGSLLVTPSKLSPLPTVCSYSFQPASSQSVLLTLVNTINGHETSTNAVESSRPQNSCNTVCSTSGCFCESKLNSLEEMDHFTVMSGAAEIACFCGSFFNLFPVVFESEKPLALIAHFSSKKVLKSFNATYQFTTNNSRYTNFGIFPPNGWKRWREIIPSQTKPKGTNAYKVYDFTWPATIPVRSKLSIDLLSEENEQDCRVWNLTIWAEHPSFINRSYLLSSLCPYEGRKEVKIPDTVRNAFIILQGVSIRTPQFEVRWKYHDTSLSTNRFPEKMGSTNNLSSVHHFTFSLILVLPKLFLYTLLHSN